MPINFDLRALKDQYGCKNFFETGFFHGDTCKKALDAGFEHVFSIELLKKYYLLGLERFKKEISDDKLLIINDDSAYLEKYLSLINSKTMFWFDAHADQGNTLEQGKFKCPIIAELEALKNLSDKEHIILIDDIRLLHQKNPWNEKEAFKEKDALTLIFEKIKEINKDYKFLYLDGYQPNDILMAYV